MSSATAEPKPYRFSVDQFNGLAESGVIPMDTSVELIDGVIFEMQPLGPGHCSISQQLADALIKTIDDSYLVRVEKPIILDDFTEPVPDIAIARKRESDPFFAQSHPSASELSLIIEVSDSSYLKDRNVKLESYAKARIPEVWIVNIPQKEIERFLNPDSESGIFADEKSFDLEEKVQGEGFSIDLGELIF